MSCCLQSIIPSCNLEACPRYLAKHGFFRQVLNLRAGTKSESACKSCVTSDIRRSERLGMRDLRESCHGSHFWAQGPEAAASLLTCPLNNAGSHGRGIVAQDANKAPALWYCFTGA